ncbi:MAG: pilus assembly FimT family protein [Parashewanella sp.]
MDSRTQQGFTLIELITTIVLIGILSVTVVPKFVGTSSYSAYTVRNDLISKLRQVQQLAINNSDQCYQLSINSNGYQTQRANRKGSDCDGANFSFIGDAYTFPDDVTVTHISNSRSFAIPFDTDGRAAQFCRDRCIRIIADNTTEISISSQGYIYED